MYKRNNQPKQFIIIDIVYQRQRNNFWSYVAFHNSHTLLSQKNGYRTTNLHYYFNTKDFHFSVDSEKILQTKNLHAVAYRPFAASNIIKERLETARNHTND